jgi:hypothetical protein
MQLFLLHSNEEDALALGRELNFPHGARLPASLHDGAIIQYGDRIETSTGRLVFQHRSAVQQARCPLQRETLLALHGIKTARTYRSSQTAEVFDSTEDNSDGEHHFRGEHFSTMYRVMVFQLEMIAMFISSSPIWLRQDISRSMIKPYLSSEFSECNSYVSRKAKREAIKVIYALGLDYGVVTIGVSTNRDVLVVDVDPVPKWGDLLCKLVADAMNRFAHALKELSAPHIPVWLGADPEFILQNEQGKVVPASRFLAREGEVGCDAVIQVRGQVIRPLVELRPPPSEHADELTAHVHRAMQGAAHMITDDQLSWLSGGMPVKGFPLGGHIHFSRIWLNTDLLRTLDNYLALPLLQLESESAAYRRPRYGFLGDFRRQPHGGFEYRTLPSWLASPIVTRGVFALAQCIANNYLSLRQRPLALVKHQAAYYQGDRDSLYMVVMELWRDLEQLATYRNLIHAVAPLKHYIQMRYRWNECVDIRKSWKIHPFI